VPDPDWRSVTDPGTLYDLYTRDGRERISGRKARLYSVACLRGPDNEWREADRLRAGLDLAERYADGLTTDEERARCKDETESVIFTYRHSSPWDVLPVLLDPRAQGALILMVTKGNAIEFWQRRSFPADLMREIFGHPFPPAAFNPTWRTLDVRLLANGIYTDRVFDRMPVLADALQEAGCDSDDLLSHLRDPHATHVRGCWALDLVLGNE
jgi:hypothetical protein